MMRITSAIAATAVISLAGCRPGPATAAHGGPSAPGRVPVTLAGPSVAALAGPSVAALGCSTWQSAPGSVTALVHVQTVLAVSHARGPQEGASGRVTVSSIDVAFLAGGAVVGWAPQATPAGKSGLVIGNGKTLLTATAYSLYLYGRWAPACRVVRVYWLPGDHS
jgi:hypothetical protein